MPFIVRPSCGKEDGEYFAQLALGANGFVLCLSFYSGFMRVKVDTDHPPQKLTVPFGIFWTQPFDTVNICVYPFLISAGYFRAFVNAYPDQNPQTQPDSSLQ